MTAFIFAGNHTNPGVTLDQVLLDQDRAAAKVEREHIIPKLKKPTRRAIMAYVRKHPGEVARLISTELRAMGHDSWVLGGEPEQAQP